MHIKASHSLHSAVELLYKYVLCCLTVRKKEFLAKQQFSINMTIANTVLWVVERGSFTVKASWNSTEPKAAEE